MPGGILPRIAPMLKTSKKPVASKSPVRRHRNGEPSIWKRLRLKGWIHKARAARPDLQPPSPDEMTLRAELFGVNQLENYAKILARNHQVEVVRKPEKLLHQLSRSADEIHRCHEIIAESVRRGSRIAPAAEWLLDN